MPRIAAALLVLMASLALPACEVVRGIFEVGFWAGIIVILLVVLVIWLIVRMVRR
ncbi:MAG TPA: hypothetical protein VF158_16880 [Longimicrobiales bacterium]